MAKVVQKTEKKEMYTVHCTECGEVIEGKFFPLKKLLEQYYYGEAIERERAQVIDALGVGAMFGQGILPDVPPLLRRKETSHMDEEDDGYYGGVKEYDFNEFRYEDFGKKRVELNTFACENNEIPDHLLKPVNLNIASIVAQFYLMTGFDTIYYMLRLWNKMEIAERNGDEVNYVERKQMNTWCDKFAELPGVKLPEMAQVAQRRKDVCAILSYILRFAKAEAEKGAQRHFATEDIYVGWRYKMVNDRQMPFSLVAKGSSGNIYHSTECCCDKCHRALSYEMGAYRQRLVGILGTQATGKTTYLTALTDAIGMGEATSLVQGNGEARWARISIQHSMVNDPQWDRVTRAPAGADAYGEAATKAGPVWLYKHGFPPEKTDMKMLEAPALNFVITGENPDGSAMEPVMYTLADIPGEAFSNVAEKKQDQLLVEKQHRLLYSCSSLIMVISSRQLLVQKDSTADETVAKDALISDPNVILGCYKNFMPDHAVPTAVVLTAADEINNGNLRRPMQLAYDLRKASPLVWSDRHGALVYNGEIMDSANTAVSEYINRNFGAFMDNLEQILRERGGRSAMSAFAVSSGTQCAPLSYSDPHEEEYHSDKQMELRYRQMCEARFGVANPLLWMLAFDGLLPVGRGDNQYNDYPRDVQEKIRQWLKKNLHT